MAKTPMRCPFSGKMCRECSLFRGRHYYLCNDNNYRGHIDIKEIAQVNKRESAVKSNIRQFDVDTLKKLCEPWSQNDSSPDYIPKIKLKVIYREDGTSRIFEPAQAKTWDWDNPRIVRTFGNVQVGSFNKLMEMIRYQEGQGAKEVTIFEAPWFLLA